MNFDFDTVMFLALFTLGAGLVIGIISMTRAKKAQDHHEDAAVAQRQRHEGDTAPVEGTPGSIDPTATSPGRSGSGPRSAPAAEASRDGNFTGSTDSGRTWSAERGANPPTPGRARE